MEQKIVRLNVNLNEETADMLKELSRQHGWSATEAVRRAIAVHKFIQDHADDGCQIVVTDRYGNSTQVVLL